MTTNEIWAIILKVCVAAFATTGLVEYLKNFIKTSKSWIYSLIMPFIAIGCYCALEFLPIAITGGILTVGTVQLNYQIIVQGFKKLFDNFVSKFTSSGEQSKKPIDISTQ